MNYKHSVLCSTRNHVVTGGKPGHGDETRMYLIMFSFAILFTVVGLARAARYKYFGDLSSHSSRVFKDTKEITLKIKFGADQEELY